MNFWAQSIASPFRVTPRYDAQKSQTPVSGSVVYNKMPGSFKIGKEREEEKKKLRWQKAGRRHYEPAMSDELFRDTNRPSATWFIDSSKKCQFGGFRQCLQNKSHQRGKKGKKPESDNHLLIFDLLRTEMKLLLLETWLNFWNANSCSILPDGNSSKRRK